MIDSVVLDPIYMWMTDTRVTVEEGPLARNTANIQNYISMTYFFAHYVRDVGAISIERAVNKACYLPAQHFRLEDRGHLAVGAYADINVFDINTLKINATFNEPCKYSSGMDYVIINGDPVIANGEFLGKRSGRVLRHLPK